MRKARSIRAVVGLLVALTATVAPSSAATTAQQHDAVPLAYAPYRDSFRMPAPPAGQTPTERAHWLLNRDTLGKTPNAWIAWARTLSATAAAPAASSQSVASAVAQLDALVGVPVTPVLRSQLVAQADRIPDAARAPFASLVATVASAYQAQLPVARDVIARVAAGLDPHKLLLTASERDAMVARQHVILGALAGFRAQTSKLFDSLARNVRDDAPLFEDPEGLVILGGTGDGTYNPGGLFGDPILLVDPAGNDTYNTSAGGACPVTLPGFDPFGLGGPWMRCNGLALSVTGRPQRRTTTTTMTVTSPRSKAQADRAGSGSCSTSRGTTRITARARGATRVRSSRSTTTSTVAARASATAASVR